jgi:LytS/YehU family sensor histidine kinase
MHIATAVVVALLAAILCGTSGYYLIGDGSRTLEAALLDLFVVAFQYHVLIYCAIVGLDHTVNYYRRYQDREVQAAQLQAQLVQAQLDILKMQLHPHFLFNTLNSISVLMQTDVQAAKHTLVCLGHLLRGALQASKDHEVALRQELEFLENYLEIERTRFQDRLTAHVRVDPSALEAQVPYFVLQPLVENAIRHGGAGSIEVVAERSNGSVHISVRDNGRGILDDLPQRREGGIGLANTRARLEKLYGDDYVFELRNLPEGGLVANITIPYRERDGYVPKLDGGGLWNESVY